MSAELENAGHTDSCESGRLFLGLYFQNVDALGDECARVVNDVQSPLEADHGGVCDEE